MDVQSSALDLMTLCAKTVSQQAIESEIPLPAGREAEEVLSAGAQLDVEEVECLAGQIRVGGTLTLQLVMQDAQRQPFGFSATSSYSQRIELPGAAPGCEAHIAAQVLECGCTLSGGKLHMHAVTETEARVFSAPDARCATGLTCQAETRMMRIETRKRVLLAEKPLRMREEVEIPVSGAVLRASGAAEVTSAQITGARAELTGILYLSLLTDSPGDGLRAQCVELPFADAFDAPFSREVWAEAEVVQLSVTPVEGDFGAADAEALLRIRLYGAEENEMTALSDAYDLTGRLSCVTETLEHSFFAGRIAQRVTLSERLRVPDGQPEAYRAVSAQVTPVVVNAESEDGRLCVSAMLLVTCLYQCDGGFIHAFSEDVPARFLLDAPCFDEAETRLTLLHCALSGNGRSFSLECTLEVSAVLYTCQQLCVVTDAVSGEALPPRRGVIICCAGAGESLWDIGKRYAVPVSALAAWNEGLTDPLPEGRALLFMK